MPYEARKIGSAGVALQAGRQIRLGAGRIGHVAVDALNQVGHGFGEDVIDAGRWCQEGSIERMC